MLLFTHTEKQKKEFENDACLVYSLNRVEWKLTTVAEVYGRKEKKNYRKTFLSLNCLWFCLENALNFAEKNRTVTDKTNRIEWKSGIKRISIVQYGVQTSNDTWKYAFRNRRESVFYDWAIQPYITNRICEQRILRTAGVWLSTFHRGTQSLMKTNERCTQSISSQLMLCVWIVCFLIFH